MSSPRNGIRIFGLGSNNSLAAAIAAHMKTKLGNITLKQFKDGEWFVQFGENLRGAHIFLVQSTNPPADHMVVTQIAIDAARRASAREITVVAPYFGYARQDRKTGPRQPISASIPAITWEALGMSRLLTVDLHNNAIEAAFRTATVDHIYARPALVRVLKERLAPAIAARELIVVSPDVGGGGRAQSYGTRLMDDVRLAIFHKMRVEANKIENMQLLGEVDGATCVLVDDMIDTGGTLVRAAHLLAEHGARNVYAAVTHGLFSGDALDRLRASPIVKLFVTDTIATQPKDGKVEVVSIAPLLGEAIHRIESGESLSALFD